MSKVTDGFTSTQLAGVKKVASAYDISLACPQTLNDISSCFAAIDFNSTTNFNSSADFNSSVDFTSAIADVTSYTILSDGIRATVDVVHHRGNFEQKLLPLQWALDQVRFNFLMF